MVNRGSPCSTCWPSSTNTSITVPAVVRLMVSLFLAFTRPLPSTTELMAPYSTVAVPTSLLAPPLFCLKYSTPPAIRATTSTSAMIRRIMRRRFFLLTGLFSASFGVSGAAGTAVSAGVSSFFSSMISAMSYSPFAILRAGRPACFQFLHANIVNRANQQQNSNKFSEEYVLIL